jgi:hypothetical protein
VLASVLVTTLYGLSGINLQYSNRNEIDIRRVLFNVTVGLLILSFKWLEGNWNR